MTNIVENLLHKMSTDEYTGNYSGHRVWYSISNIVATSAVIKMIVENQLTVDFFIAYMGMVGGYSVAIEMIRSKLTDSSSLLSSGLPSIDSLTDIIESGDSKGLKTTGKNYEQIKD